MAKVSGDVSRLIASFLAKEDLHNFVFMSKTNMIDNWDNYAAYHEPEDSSPLEKWSDPGPLDDDFVLTPCTKKGKKARTRRRKKCTYGCLDIQNYFNENFKKCPKCQVEYNKDIIEVVNFYEDYYDTDFFNSRPDISEHDPEDWLPSDFY
jgi:hypothetical protein